MFLPLGAPEHSLVMKGKHDMPVNSLLLTGIGCGFFMEELTLSGHWHWIGFWQAWPMPSMLEGSIGAACYVYALPFCTWELLLSIVWKVCIGEHSLPWVWIQLCIQSGKWYSNQSSSDDADRTLFPGLVRWGWASQPWSRSWYCVHCEKKMFQFTEFPTKRSTTELRLTYSNCLLVLS